MSSLERFKYVPRIKAATSSQASNGYTSPPEASQDSDVTCIPETPTSSLSSQLTVASPTFSQSRRKTPVVGAGSAQNSPTFYPITATRSPADSGVGVRRRLPGSQSSPPVHRVPYHPPGRSSGSATDSEETYASGLSGSDGNITTNQDTHRNNVGPADTTGNRTVQNRVSRSPSFVRSPVGSPGGSQQNINVNVRAKISGQTGVGRLQNRAGRSSGPGVRHVSGSQHTNHASTGRDTMVQSNCSEGQRTVGTGVRTIPNRTGQSSGPVKNFRGASVVGHTSTHQSSNIKAQRNTSMLYQNAAQAGTTGVQGVQPGTVRPSVVTNVISHSCGSQEHVHVSAQRNTTVQHHQKQRQTVTTNLLRVANQTATPPGSMCNFGGTNASGPSIGRQGTNSNVKTNQMVQYHQNMAQNVTTSVQRLQPQTQGPVMNSGRTNVINQSGGGQRVHVNAQSATGLHHHQVGRQNVTTSGTKVQQRAKQSVGMPRQSGGTNVSGHSGREQGIYVNAQGNTTNARRNAGMQYTTSNVQLTASLGVRRVQHQPRMSPSPVKNHRRSGVTSSPSGTQLRDAAVPRNTTTRSGVNLLHHQQAVMSTGTVRSPSGKNDIATGTQAAQYQSGMGPSPHNTTTQPDVHGLHHQQAGMSPRAVRNCSGENAIGLGGSQHVDAQNNTRMGGHVATGVHAGQHQSGRGPAPHSTMTQPDVHRLQHQQAGTSPGTLRNSGGANVISHGGSQHIVARDNTRMGGHSIAGQSTRAVQHHSGMRSVQDPGGANVGGSNHPMYRNVHSRPGIPPGSNGPRTGPSGMSRAHHPAGFSPSGTSLSPGRQGMNTSTQLNAGMQPLTDTGRQFATTGSHHVHQQAGRVSGLMQSSGGGYVSGSNCDVNINFNRNNGMQCYNGITKQAEATGDDNDEVETIPDSDEEEAIPDSDEEEVSIIGEGARLAPDKVVQLSPITISNVCSGVAIASAPPGAVRGSPVVNRKVRRALSPWCDVTTQHSNQNTGNQMSEIQTSNQTAAAIVDHGEQTNNGMAQIDEFRGDEADGLSDVEEIAEDQGELEDWQQAELYPPDEYQNEEDAYYQQDGELVGDPGVKDGKNYDQEAESEVEEILDSEEEQEQQAGEVYPDDEEYEGDYEQDGTYAKEPYMDAEDDYGTANEGAVNIYGGLETEYGDDEGEQDPEMYQYNDNGVVTGYDETYGEEEYDGNPLTTVHDEPLQGFGGAQADYEGDQEQEALGVEPLYDDDNYEADGYEEDRTFVAEQGIMAGNNPGNWFSEGGFGQAGEMAPAGYEGHQGDATSQMYQYDEYGNDLDQGTYVEEEDAVFMDDPEVTDEEPLNDVEEIPEEIGREGQKGQALDMHPSFYENYGNDLEQAATFVESNGNRSNPRTVGGGGQHYVQEVVSRPAVGGKVQTSHQPHGSFQRQFNTAVTVGPVIAERGQGESTEETWRNAQVVQRQMGQVTRVSGHHEHENDWRQVHQPGQSGSMEAGGRTNAQGIQPQRVQVPGVSGQHGNDSRQVQPAGQRGSMEAAGTNAQGVKGQRVPATGVSGHYSNDPRQVRTAGQRGSMQAVGRSAQAVQVSGASGHHELGNDLRQVHPAGQIGSREAAGRTNAQVVQGQRIPATGVSGHHGNDSKQVQPAGQSGYLEAAGKNAQVVKGQRVPATGVSGHHECVTDLRQVHQPVQNTPMARREDGRPGGHGAYQSQGFQKGAGRNIQVVENQRVQASVVSGHHEHGNGLKQADTSVQDRSVMVPERHGGPVTAAGGDMKVVGGQRVQALGNSLKQVDKSMVPERQYGGFVDGAGEGMKVVRGQKENAAGVTGQLQHGNNSRQVHTPVKRTSMSGSGDKSPRSISGRSNQGWDNPPEDQRGLVAEMNALQRCANDLEQVDGEDRRSKEAAAKNIQQTVSIELGEGQRRQLAEMFPHHSAKDVRNAMDQCDGSLSIAASILVDAPSSQDDTEDELPDPFSPSKQTRRESDSPVTIASDGENNTNDQGAGTSQGSTQTSVINRPQRKRRRVLSSGDDDSDNDTEDDHPPSKNPPSKRHQSGTMAADPKKASSLLSKFAYNGGWVSKSSCKEQKNPPPKESSRATMSNGAPRATSKGTSMGKKDGVHRKKGTAPSQRKKKPARRRGRFISSDEDEEYEDDFIVQDESLSEAERTAEEEEEEAVDEVTSEEEDDGDNYHGNEQFSESFQTEVHQFFNSAPREELEALGGCSRMKAEKIIEIRPFENFADVVEKMEATKYLTSNLIENCEELFGERQLLSEVLNDCSTISSKIESALDRENELLNGDRQMAFLDPSLSLKPYQLIGVNWMKLLHKHKINGILADEMGLGKTIQVIAFLASLLEEGDEGPHLIVAPASTLDNWHREFNKWAPSMEAILYTGDRDYRMQLADEIKYGQLACNVLITSYNTATSEQDYKSLFRKLKLQYSVFDEGHMLKNIKSLRFKSLMKIKSQQKLLLTGTPLQNNLLELMSLISFVVPKLDSQEKMQTLQRIFSRVTGGDESAFVQDRIRQAKQIMQPFVLRRVKDQVLKQLPQKNIQVEVCPMVQHQKDFYHDLKASYQSSRELSEVVGRRPGDKTMMAAVMELRKQANHPLLMRRIYTDEKLAEMSKLMIREPTHRDANPDLIFEDMSVMSDFELHRLCQQYASVSQYRLEDERIRESGKFKALDRILPKLKEQGLKVLIFSQFVMMLDILEPYMKLCQHRYLRMDGSTSVTERGEVMDKFISDPDIFVFLLSTKACGLGINLTIANTVILHDIDYNPHNDKQAEDRCHRLGQTKDVTVIKLVSQGTIDESMLQRAQQKLHLEKQMISGESADGDEERVNIDTLLKEALELS